MSLMQRPFGVKRTPTAATMPGTGQMGQHPVRGSINDPRQRPGSLRAPVGFGTAAYQVNTYRCTVASSHLHSCPFLHTICVFLTAEGCQ